MVSATTACDNRDNTAPSEAAILTSPFSQFSLAASHFLESDNNASVVIRILSQHDRGE